jgi:hypothetical protein
MEKSWRQQCFEADCEGACGDTCMMFVKPKPDPCPFCGVDFAGKGHIFRIDHSDDCEGYRKSVSWRPLTAKQFLKALKKLCKE